MSDKTLPRGAKSLVALAFALLATLFGSPTSQGFVMEPADTSANVADLRRANSGPGVVSPIEQPFLELLKRLGTEDPTKQHTKTLAREQEPHDYHARLSTAQILHRSGFKHELYNSTSLDGYITQLVRIVNPYVKRAQLRRRPVVLYTGQGTSPAAFLAASPGSQRPTRWPARSSAHGGRAKGGRSYHKEEGAGHDDRHHQLEGRANRSLAVALANNGYDVWLVPTRGVDAQNRARLLCEGPALAAPGSLTDHKLDLLKNFSPPAPHATSRADPKESPLPREECGRQRAKLARPNNYWSFSNDEIIEKEFEVQLERVRSISKAEKLSLITYSNGGFITFGFLASHPDYAQKHLDVIVNLAPAVYMNKFNLALGLAGMYNQFSPDVWPVPQDDLDAVARTSLVSLCKSRLFRYSVCKLLLDQLFGSSDLFNTHLELAILDYVGRPTSGPALKQLLQTAYSGHMRQYEQDFVGNVLLNGEPEPHDYELQAVNHQRLYIVSGQRDAIADEASLAKLVKEIGRPPAKWLEVPGYNHLDLLAGHNNAERVNQPVLKMLDDRFLELERHSARDQGHGEHEEHTNHEPHHRERGGRADEDQEESDYKNHQVDGDHAQEQHHDTGFLVVDQERHLNDHDPEREREQEPEHESEHKHEYEHDYEHDQEHEVDIATDHSDAKSVRLVAGPGATASSQAYKTSAPVAVATSSPVTTRAKQQQKERQQQSPVSKSHVIRQ